MKRIFFLLLWLLNIQAVYALDFAKEYEIKAAFLINLGSFISWPEKHFASEKEPFHICVLGNDPFGDGLNVLAENRYIDKHPVEIHRFNDTNQINTCEIIFICESEQLKFKMILNQLKGWPILIVGDTSNFVLSGGMVQFFLRQNKVRLMVDPQSFHEVGLKPSSQLMRVAQPIERHQ